MNTLTHKWNLDGSLSRKPPKEGKRKKKGKIVPAKGKTSWGRIYADGREVCDLKLMKGRFEYARRTEEMVERQLGFCKCSTPLVLRKNSENGLFQRYSIATFGHDTPRGMGGGLRDDRIWDADGKPMNHAECWECNSKKGSKRA